MFHFRHAASLLLVGLLGACQTWMGNSEDGSILPGDRIAILDVGSGLLVDPGLDPATMNLPQPWLNDMWPQRGGLPDHVMGHLSLNNVGTDGDGQAAEAHPPLQVRASFDLGDGDSGMYRLGAQPILVENTLFALDSRACVSAIEMKSGKTLWEVRVSPPEEDALALGGGLAFADGMIFVTTGYADVMALDPANGGQVWRRALPAPARAAPASAYGRVFVPTLDNQLFALSARDGSVLWTHTGMTESAGLFGAAQPTVKDAVVVAAFSSGEIFALRSENGRVLWSDALTVLRHEGTLTRMPDIGAAPVIDADGLVHVIGYAGRMVAIDLRSGIRVWEREIGGSSIPWIAGDAIFVLDEGHRLAALRRRTGQVFWVTELPAFRDPEDRDGPIRWQGPVLAGGRLWVIGSNRQLRGFDPATGDELSSQRIPRPAHVPPLVAGGQLLLLDHSAGLTAYSD